MKILAVDDDPIVLELLTQFVDLVGDHQLTTALSGVEALEEVCRSGYALFDCFLFDLQMPQMDGIELVRRVRELPVYRNTPILMLTAMSDKRYVDAAFSAGATDYITKPFEIPELRARLGVVEALVEERQARAKKVFASQAVSAKAKNKSIQLHEPIFIYDVDNVIDYVAMENYVAQLVRGSLFGSTTFAFAIRKIGDHHQSMSAFDFSSLIADVAEVISDTLTGHQFLMSYVGSGTFVCVTESGWKPEMKSLTDSVNLSLSQIELYNSNGEELHVRVSGGDAIRLIWKTESTVMDAISAAYNSAEEASAAYGRAQSSFWYGQ